MKVYPITLYNFKELEESVQKKLWQANNEYVHEVWQNDFNDCLQNFIVHFDLEHRSRYLNEFDYRPKNENLLTGNRLRTWILNNYRLSKPAYKGFLEGKRTGKQFIFEYKERFNRTFLYSRFNNNPDFLTGLCYDYTLLEPINKFIAYPVEGVTWNYLIELCMIAARKLGDSEYEHHASFGYFSEDQDGYLFTKKGKLIYESELE